MLKKVIGAKGTFLLAGVIMMASLSGCGNDPTEQDSAGTIIEEASENQETEHSEQTGTEDNQRGNFGYFQIRN